MPHDFVKYTKCLISLSLSPSETKFVPHNTLQLRKAVNALWILCFDRKALQGLCAARARLWKSLVCVLPKVSEHTEIDRP
jgi:hypothetical protein